MEADITWQKLGESHRGKEVTQKFHVLPIVTERLRDYKTEIREEEITTPDTSRFLYNQTQVWYLRLFTKLNYEKISNNTE